MNFLLKSKFHSSFHSTTRNNWFTIASLNSGRQLICSSGGNENTKNRGDVDPFLFVFHKWGISWNSVGLFFALMAACYWNIFTQDRSLGIVLGVGVFILSLVFPSEFFSLFQGLTKTSLAEWYVYQGYKVEQQVRKNPVLGAGIFLLLIGLCLAMYMGDSIIRADAGLALRIFRGITYPYVALVLLFRGSTVLNDPSLLKDIADAIKLLLKYPQEKPGKATTIAVVGGTFALFSYYERKKEQEDKKKEKEREEGLRKEEKEREEVLEELKNLREEEKQELANTQDLLMQASLNPDPSIRMRAEDVMGKLIEHRRDHNVHPPISDMVPQGLESFARRVEKANELHTDALEIKRMALRNKLGDTTKVIDYGRSPKSPLEDHFNWGDWMVSWIM